MLAWLRRLVGRGAPADPLVGLDPEQTRLVIGLGNPGPRYTATRHNVGFRALDELGQRLGARWASRQDLNCELAVVETNGRQLVLAKPQTFMNRSGEAVAALVERLQLEPRHALVVYDDMDLPFGTLRLRERGSPGTHNGMRSVIAELGSADIPRLRMGISQASNGVAIDHVLGEFDLADRPAADDLIRRTADAVEGWAILGPAKAMNRYNKG